MVLDFQVMYEYLGSIVTPNLKVKVKHTTVEKFHNDILCEPSTSAEIMRWAIHY